MKKVGITLPTSYVDVTNEEMEYMEGSWDWKLTACVGGFCVGIAALTACAYAIGGSGFALCVGIPSMAVMGVCAGIAAVVENYDAVSSFVGNAVDSIKNAAGTIIDKVSGWF